MKYIVFWEYYDRKGTRLTQHKRFDNLSDAELFKNLLDQKIGTKGGPINPADIIKEN